jgi:hypothetical protein
VDRQLRHAQDRLVDARQPVVDGVADTYRQPTTCQPDTNRSGCCFTRRFGLSVWAPTIRKGPVRSASSDRHATSEPARTVKYLPSAGHSSRSESSVNPAALSRWATVTQT